MSEPITVTLGDAKAVVFLADKITEDEFNALPLDIQNGRLVAVRSTARLIACDGRDPASLTEAEGRYAAAWEKLGEKKGAALTGVGSQNGDGQYVWLPSAPMRKPHGERLPPPERDAKSAKK